MWGLELKRNSEIPLKRQVYQALRDRITSGKLDAGEALPSTRELALELNISRNTASEAYEMLICEGFVVNHQGASTRVAEDLWVRRSQPVERPETPAPESLWRADFQTGQPDLKFFPRTLWEKMLYKTARDLPVRELGYAGPQGLARLREEIAAWLYRSRGLSVKAADIFITAGATHALHLVAELLYQPGQAILCEDPCHNGMLQAFLNRGCRVIPLPVDKQGIQVEYLNDQSAALIYLTPSHQFPLGGILPAGRRASLIRYARSRNGFIIEDDYDSEFRYQGDPVAPFYALEPQQVIYVGTFSKILFPALRVGYVILPPRLQKAWSDLRTHTDVQNPPFEQAALAEFLATRNLDKHIRKMRRIYGERRQILLEALKQDCGRGWEVWGDSAGLHLAVEFPGRCFDQAFLDKSREYGIRLNTVDDYSIRKGRHLNKLLLGYGHLEPEAIRQGVRLLRDLMRLSGSSELPDNSDTGS